MYADLILFSNAIFDSVSDVPFAGGVAVSGKKIQAVGSRGEIEPLIGPDTKVLELGNRLVMPGFIDSHGHFGSGAEFYSEVAYQIRQGVKFWDGNEMTADDVVYSLNRHMDADNASLFGYMFAPVESIEKTGDYEVTIHLSTPDTSFMYVVATMAGSVVEQSYVEEQGEYFGTSSGGTMGTGPYKYDSWTDGSQLVFTKNEDYWNSDTQYVSDTLEFDIIEDTASITLAIFYIP